MCNPPFYTSLEDIARSAEGKELPPSAVRLQEYYVYQRSEVTPGLYWRRDGNDHRGRRIRICVQDGAREPHISEALPVRTVQSSLL